jgi:hypothetical protein
VLRSTFSNLKNLTHLSLDLQGNAIGGPVPINQNITEVYTSKPSMIAGNFAQDNFPVEDRKL